MKVWFTENKGMIAHVAISIGIAILIVALIIGLIAGVIALMLHNPWVLLWIFLSICAVALVGWVAWSIYMMFFDN